MAAHALVMALLAAALAGPGDAGIQWSAGPHLFIDKTLIAQQQGLAREVNHPTRWPEPIVTGYEDGCFQPYLTVLHDPAMDRFRMWYGVPATPQNPSQATLAYLESKDGLHWLRPHRLLETPPIQFGSSVLDEGPAFSPPQARYKFAWWKDGGLQIATSPDGFHWKQLGDGVLLPMNHDITGIDWDPIRKRYMALLSAVPGDGPYKKLRIPHQSVSDDLLKWRAPWPIVVPDPNAAIEKGETQFYGMSAVLPRGSLLVSTVKVLRDDLNCEPGKTAAELHDPNRPFGGIGYSVLAWSRDGEHWQRETQPFLDRNPASGTWDRAMAWIDDQLIVGDHTYLYYGGYRWGHKAERFTGRQIGFAQLPRDRYVGYTATDETGRLVTQSAPLAASGMTVNARIDPAGGELKVRVLDQDSKPLPGFDWQDGAVIRGDRVNHPCAWKEKLAKLNGRRVCFEFSFKNAALYSFDLSAK